jgi:rhomboid protease GluP
MCPNCRAFISSSDRVCPYCEANVGPRAVDIRSSQNLNFIPRAYTTSVLILVINFALYLAMVIVSVRFSPDSTASALGHVWSGFSSAVLVLFGGKYAPFIFQYDQWWRLITAGFLHGGLLHIAINMWVMFELVAEVEQFYGTPRLIVMYVGSTFTGFLLSLWWSPMSLSIGASAACFGLIGAMLAIGLQRTNPLAQAVRSYYMKWAIYGLIFSFFPGPNIDIAAHVGGLAGGFAIGYITGFPGLPGSPKERFWTIFAGALVVITVLCFYLDLRSFQVLTETLRR